MAHRTAAVLTTAILMWSLASVAPLDAGAASLGCEPGDLGCVTVVATNPGGAGGSGSASAGAGPGGTVGVVAVDPANCSQYPAPYINVCLSGRGGGTLPPCLALYTQYRWQLAPDALNAFLAGSGCPTLPPGTAPAGAPPSPAQLAEQAAASFLLPSPTGSRSPLVTDTYDGVPVTYVNLWTFFFTSPVSWRPLSATASAGGVSATVVATPVSLTFDPGDGSPPAVCTGPGRPWTSADGNSPPAEGACGYRYEQVTGPGNDHPLTVTQKITWQLTWTGTGNTAGVLTARTTSTSGLLNVLQIQTVDESSSNGGN